jgi:hypothetical protein
MYQVMNQWKPEKATVNWDAIQLPGRTRKALQNTWGKLMQDMLKKVAEYQDGQAAGGPSASTPTCRSLLHPVPPRPATLPLAFLQPSHS